MNHRLFSFRSLWLLLLLALWGLPVKGQQSSIVPPPPEAAALFKSTDIPVSLYTGLPNIGVDFYTIKTKELQVPIRISYNARGIQVAEVASRVGLGWALQYGGMISRQIRGSADELTYGLLDKTNNNYYNRAFTDSLVRGNMYHAMNYYNIDEYPDQFYYDVNGESGKFTFDHNDGKVVLQKFGDIKIEPSFNCSHGVTLLGEGIVSWVVTDKLGNKYYYGCSKDGTRHAVDHTHSTRNFSFSNLKGVNQDLISEDSRVNSAWHLMEIETYLKERIEFHYKEELGMQYQRSFDRIEYPGPEPMYSNPENGNAATTDVKSYFSEVYSIQYQIEEIRFPGGKVSFVSDTTGRKDYTGTQALHKVLVTDDNSSLVKGFELSQFYTRCKDDNNQLNHLKQLDDAANYRLFLSQIQEFYSSGPRQPPYKFEYNEMLLPNRHSNAQDNWGYYNGKDNGRFLTFLTYLQQVSREVDPTFSGAGMLQKIIYPTGGSTTFIYEQNRVFPPAYIEELLYNQNNPADTVVVWDGFTRDSSFYGDGAYSKVITIGSDIQPGTPVVFSLFQPQATEDYDPADSKYRVVLEGLDNSTTLYLFPPSTEKELFLQPGRYHLKVLPESDYDPNAYGSAFMVDLKWSIIIKDPDLLEASDGAGVWYGAGKRIKRIEYRNNEHLVKFREYEYKDENGKSSGVMFGLPNFCFLQKVVPLAGGQEAPIIDQFGSMPGKPLSYLQGNSLGYSRVTEYYGDSSVNQGKAEYQFTVDVDAGRYYKFPYHLPIDFEWLRGLPLSTKVYSNENGSYNLLKSTQNTYLYAGMDEHPNRFTQPFLHSDSVYVYRKDRNLYYLPLLKINASFENADQYVYKVYYQSAGTVDLESTTETDYANGKELAKVTRYGFSYPKHYLSNMQHALTSKGDSVITTITYPADLEGKTAAEQKLVDANRIALPLKAETTVKNAANVVKEKTTNQTVYKDWGVELPVLPEQVLSARNNAPLQSDIIYGGYNPQGSPLEVVSRAGVKEVYVWGYKKLYPVAKVVGSNYNTVIGMVDTVLLENAAQYSDAQLRAELNKIRTGLASTPSEVFTYTYKPLVGVTSATDPRGRTIYYEYDGAGRLSLMRDHEHNVIKMNCYNYQGQLESCGTFGNELRSGTFTRNNCEDGATSGEVTYTVAANTYFATTHVAANLLAQQDVDVNGQAYANLKGSCTKVFYNEEKQVTFTKQCAAGGAGSQVTYVVAAKTYSSLVSQEDADLKAQNDITANGQIYANQNGTCTWYSVEKSGTFVKSNCATGGSGSSVTYTVAARTYSSTNSQEDADQKADNDVQANGQAYANQNGYCTWYNVEQSGTFTRNNCTYGAVGSQVTYTVAARTHSSTLSQEDANQKAINQVNANGQSYANSTGTCLWYSHERSGTFIKNDCPPGFTGTTVTYTVPAGRYTSTVSQDDANMLAQADVNWSGQAHANANGSCVSSCSTATCSGEGQKCVGGTCEQGVRIFTSSVYNSAQRTYTCTYHYEWSDGSWSESYTMTTPFACNTGGGILD